jgi:AcrR family transcriptional regulator
LTAKRRWKQDPLGRRRRILAAATEEFGANGYAAARVDKIAAQAGVAEGTVYHQFGSKRGLLEAVGDRYGEKLVEAAFGGVPPEPSPDEAEAVIRSIFAYVRDQNAPLGAFVLANQPGEADAAQTATRARMLRALETRLARWCEAGTVAPLDPRIGAELIFGLTESALRDCFLRDGGREEATYVRETTRMIRRYLS